MDSTSTQNQDDTVLSMLLGDLNLDDNPSDDDDDVDDRILKDKAEILRRFKIGKETPFPTYKLPLLFRTVHSQSPSGQDNGDLQSRLYPPPGESFEDLTKSSLQYYVLKHSCLSNYERTPFISVTDDLLRALSMYNEKPGMEIILIDPSSLTTGSYRRCNDLRSQCYLPRADIYNTEYLIWGRIPRGSILCRWPLSRILTSGLLRAIPSFSRLRCAIGVKKVRDILRSDIQSFDPAIIADALSSLPGMNPSSPIFRKIFMLLFGGAIGYRMEKREADLENLESMSHVKAFDRAAYKLTKSNGKKALLNHYKKLYPIEVKERCPQTHPDGTNCTDQEKRKWRKLYAYEMDKLFVPSFGLWWSMRQEDANIDVEGGLTHSLHALARSLNEFSKQILIFTALAS